jgi:pimeloyl-ACP methyl ester carboxylesterase
MSPVPTPPGRLVDVGGYCLHIQMQGNGAPAAVLDSGLAGNSIIWTNTLSALADHTQACAFDRAGYAWSEPAPPEVPRTSRQIVAEVRTLLSKAGAQPPYILLGHSFGAINMLVYAYQQPGEVAGMVLVDPSHPDMFERMPRVPPPKTVERGFKLISGLGRLGLLRLLGPMLARQLLPDGRDTLPAEAWEALVFFASRSDDFRTAAREASFGIENFAQARGDSGSLHDLPLEVLTAEYWTAGKQTPMKRAAVELREEMAQLSSRGRHIVVTGCDHTNLPIVRPDAIVDSVRHILEVLEKD